MKKITIILLILIFTTNCTNADKSNIMIGTWKISDDKEHYSEIKIDKTNIIVLASNENDLRIENIRFVNDYLIIENENYEPKIDSFKLICHSKDKIILKRKFLGQLLEFNKIENEIKNIDSVNFESWKEKTISDFNERANLYFNSNNIKKSVTIDLGNVEIYEEIETPLDTIR